MQITSGSNRFTFIVAIVYILLLAASFYVKIANIIINQNEYYVANILLEALHVLLLIYLIRILIAIKEPTYIVAAFIAYAGFIVVQFLIGALHTGTLSPSVDATLGMVTIILVLCLAFQAFRIKNSYVRASFRLFAGSFIFEIILKMALALAFAKFANRQILNYMGLVALLTPATILLILRDTGKMLNDNNGVIGGES